MDPTDLDQVTEPVTDRWRSWCWTAAGVVLLAGCVELTWFSWNLPETLPEQVLAYLFHFRWGWIPAGILLLYIPYLAALLLARSGVLPLGVVLGVSILARLLLVPGFPILETDFYRYLWDGRMMNIGQNPFEHSPWEIQMAIRRIGFLEEAPPDVGPVVEAVEENLLHLEILDHINNKRVPTIYFPVAQAAFAVSDRLILALCPTRSDAPDTDWATRALWAAVVWKSVLIVFEIGNLFLIVSILRLLGRHPAWVVVYGWSPLILKEYANTGHFDPIAIFFMLTALLVLGYNILRSERKERRWLSQFTVGTLLGVAAATKLFPVLFVGPLHRRLGLAGALAVPITLLLLFTPFLRIGSGVLAGFLTYSDRWESNSSLVAFGEWAISGVQDLTSADSAGATGPEPSPLFNAAGVEFTLDAFFVAKSFSALLILSVLAWVTWKARRQSAPLEPQEEYRKLLRSCYVLLGTLLLASPVTNPWYVGWIVPFLCFFPGPAWLFLTFSLQAYYLYFWNDWAYVKMSDIPWLNINLEWEIARPIEYLPFFGLLAWDWWRNRKCRILSP